MKLFSPIIIFMIASAGIHSAFVIIAEPSTIILPGSTGSMMVVKLKEKNTTKQLKKPQQEKQIETTATKAPATIKKNKHSEIQPQKHLFALAEQQSKSKAHVVSILIEEFNQYFSYPKFAKRRNWQGKVLLSLRITSSGKIKNIQIDNSSGYNILDQAAINSMRKVGKLPKTASWLENDIDLEIPVVYQLIKG